MGFLLGTLFLLNSPSVKKDSRGKMRQILLVIFTVMINLGNDNVVISQTTSGNKLDGVSQNTTMAPTAIMNLTTVTSTTRGVNLTNNSGSITTMSPSNTSVTTSMIIKNTSSTQSSGQMLSGTSSISSISISTSGSGSMSNTMAPTPNRDLTPTITTNTSPSTNMNASGSLQTNPAASNLASTVNPTGSTATGQKIIIAATTPVATVTLETTKTISTQLSSSPSSGDVNKNPTTMAGLTTLVPSTTAKIMASTKRSWAVVDPDPPLTIPQTTLTTGKTTVITTSTSIATTVTTATTQNNNNVISSSQIYKNASSSAITTFLSTSTGTPIVKANYSISFTNDTWIPEYANMTLNITKTKVLELQNKIATALGLLPSSTVIFSLSQGSVVANAEITSKQSLNQTAMSAAFSSIGAQLISSTTPTPSTGSMIPSSTKAPDNSSLPVYAIILIAVFSAVAFLIIVFVVTVVICRRRKLKDYDQA